MARSTSLSQTGHLDADPLPMTMVIQTEQTHRWDLMSKRQEVGTYGGG